MNNTVQVELNMQEAEALMEFLGRVEVKGLQPVITMATLITRVNQSIQIGAGNIGNLGEVKTAE